MPVVAIDIPGNRRVDQSHFTFGVKSLAEQDLSANVDQVGTQGAGVRGDKPAAVAVEVAAELRAAEFDAAICQKASRENYIAANLSTASIDRNLAAALELAAATGEAAADCSADQPDLPNGSELVAEPNVSSDFGVVKVQCYALLFYVFGFHPMKGQPAIEVEVAADVCVDEIEATEYTGGEQIKVFGNLDRTRFNVG